jgi:epoxyqueuosine reductase
MIDAAVIKRMATEKGAALCGIAPVERFADAPEGFHPVDIFPGCKSVVVLASPFPASGLQCSTNAPYTFVRNMMVERMDRTSFLLAAELEQEGIAAVPIPSAEPYDYWDEERKHGRGILSLKHSAQLAGLGTLGKNTLLINKTYGNMIWLGAVLVSVALVGDEIAAVEGCLPDCVLCLEQCPQHALDGKTIDQKSCRALSISSTPGGGYVLSCNICRKVCPSRTGIKRKTGPTEHTKDTEK